MTAAAWLGVLRAHQSRVEEALALLRPAARGQIGVEHTSATLHSLLFTGHAHALAGRPAMALAAFTRYTAEVERRQVPRFAGRAVNFAGWVLRNLGAGQQGLDQHHEALEVARRQGTAGGHRRRARGPGRAPPRQGRRRPRASPGWRRPAPNCSRATWSSAGGWRSSSACSARRLALLRGQPEPALAEATGLAAAAAALGVPRYTCVARLLAHRASRAMSLPVDLATVAADLDLLDQSVAIEAWRWTCDLALDFASPALLDRAAGPRGPAGPAGRPARRRTAAGRRRLPEPPDGG